ncbi:MAG: YebC/PmpR family DNA-binding transcriptional regulator [Alphaproteobacteria bacterium]|nr:YebC/PmpR family DNA-binding transcriptional regulator [Alphaproteobacteria bacterium]
MAGHSKFKNIQHRKGAQDKKRAKIFTRLVREIVTAAKSGQPDPEFNPRLRSAITTAKSMNLPKERIDRAIALASSGDDNTNYTEIRYEGYAPGGVAIIVEALTDNKNRTASEVRAAFNKYGGNLGETGCVGFMFDHLGIISYDSLTLDDSKLLKEAIELGAIDAEAGEGGSFFYTAIEDFSTILGKSIEKFGAPDDACIGWKPKNPQKIEEEDRIEKIQKLIDALEESEDVQKVFANLE